MKLTPSVVRIIELQAQYEPEALVSLERDKVWDLISEQIPDDVLAEHAHLEEDAISDMEASYDAMFSEMRALTLGGERV